MSIANFLRPATLDEDWSKVYFKEVTADVINAATIIVDDLTVSNLIVDDLEAKTVTIGVSPTQYTLPTVRATTDKRVLFGDADGKCEFEELGRFSFNHGGSLNANPRFLIVNGVPNNAAAATDGTLSQSRVPFTSRIAYFSMVSTDGDNTSQFNLYKNAVLFKQFSFTSGIFVPPTDYTFAAGDRYSISWAGVGTQPNDTSLMAFFNQNF